MVVVDRRIPCFLRLKLEQKSNFVSRKAGAVGLSALKSGTSLIARGGLHPLRTEQLWFSADDPHRDNDDDNGDDNHDNEPDDPRICREQALLQQSAKSPRRRPSWGGGPLQPGTGCLQPKRPAWARRFGNKVNAELVTLTYGTIVAQLCKDYDNDYEEVNRQLDKMGYNIGLRLIEDYLAKSVSMKRCNNFRETADMISKVGFKIFLNTSPTITNWTSDGKQFSLVFDENPLADFVELPDDGRAQDELWYSNILCGVLRGALEMVQVQVDAHFISDVLRGNDTTEMRISLIRYIDDEMPPEDD